MSVDRPPESVRYVLPLPAPEAGSPVSAAMPDHGFGYRMLRGNIAWFITLRWAIAGLFVALAAAVESGLPERLSVTLRPGWLLLLAAILAVANTLYIVHARALTPERLLAVHANLWVQIAVDLAAVAVVVQRVGAYLTFAPFLFLVHIVLACIFFARRESFCVLLYAILLYTGCLGLEAAAIVQPHQAIGLTQATALTAGGKIAQAASAVLLWLTVWWLVSRLSVLVRQRQQEVIAARERALQTHRDGQLHLRHTAHQMKAPLDAIRSHVHLLLEGYGGNLEPKVGDALRRIDARCDGLAEFVEDVLHLARMKAGEAVAPARERVDLAALIGAAIDALSAKATARQVTIERTLTPLPIVGLRETLAMMVDNLLTNAINYSYQGGQVTVTCQADPAGGGTVTIADRGIGIAPEKLPHIFEEYYRTDEARQHNRHSTGVGLAIVKEAAIQHRIGLDVTSAPGQGTTFRLSIPPG